MIDLQVRVLAELGIRDVAVHVNSLGSGDTRARYREALLAHFTPRRGELSEDSQRRLEKNPLRILDSKDPRDHAASEGAPTILDVLSEEDRAHFDGVKSALAALGIAYVVDPKLVRGLDYYTRTTWEFVGPALGAQSTISGGGRYDGLVEEIGGPATPGVGFGAGLERLVLALEEAGTTADPPAVDVFFLVDPDVPDERRRAARVRMDALRRSGVSAETDYAGRSRKGQLTQARRVGAKVLVEVSAESVAIQGSHVDLDRVEAEVLSRLGR
jgi:histidyl-tRNA synthetase